MSEIQPNSAASDRLLRVKGLKRSQEKALEEKVSGEVISLGLGPSLCVLWSAATEIPSAVGMTEMGHLPSGHRAVLESCSGRAEWSCL